MKALPQLPPHIKLTLYNTQSRSKEVLKPIEDDHVKMYTCGPTVYNFAHIGNFRTYVFEDLLRRTIKFFGMKITHVMNLTDLDDKTIRGSIDQKVSLAEFTRPFIDAFFVDLNTLHIESAEKYPAATDYINEMIAMIAKLVDKGIAYKGTDGSIYYAIKKFPKYGCLSHLHIDELKAGASERIVADEYDKENVADFVLWKALDKERDGDIFWDSPWGLGRPGWHIECSAMATKLLGDTIDIHVGGIDNMFPHHENEIAQSEGCTNKTFAHVWMHSEHLIVDGKKMSKSAGNFFTLRDLLKKDFTGTEVRYMLLQTHYKTQLNFTFAGLEAVRGSLQRLQDFIFRLQHITAEGEHGLVEPVTERAYVAFAAALADDLNISAALAALFEMVREVNALSDAGKLSRSEAQKVLTLLKRFNEVLGVLSFEKAVDGVPQDLQEALTKRNEARKAKDWALADQLRDLIASRGYVIEDGSEGARLKKVAK